MQRKLLGRGIAAVIVMAGVCLLTSIARSDDTKKPEGNAGGAGAQMDYSKMTPEQQQAAMKQYSQPGTITIVFVLTDGRDSGATSRAFFLAHLSPDVPVYGLGYGIGADMTALREAARVTGGQAVAAGNPRDLDTAVAAMFLAAHQRQAG